MNFDRVWNMDAKPLSADEERAALEAAQAGDSEAVLRILRAYLPAMNAAIRPYVDALGHLLDELRAEAVVGMMQAIREWDGSRSRLGRTAGLRVMEALAEAVANYGPSFTVAARTLRRYFGILREAAGDVQEALKLCPEKGMSPQTFAAVHYAVDVNTLVLDGEEEEDDEPVREGTPLWQVLNEYVVVEDKLMVEAAFSAMDDLEREVVKHAYGFYTYGRPMTDSEVAYHLGLTNRLKALRVRERALSKAREKLGVVN